VAAVVTDQLDVRRAGAGLNDVPGRVDGEQGDEVRRRVATPAAGRAFPRDAVSREPGLELLGLLWVEVHVWYPCRARLPGPAGGKVCGGRGRPGRLIRPAVPVPALSSRAGPAARPAARGGPVTGKLKRVAVRGCSRARCRRSSPPAEQLRGSVEPPAAGVGRWPAGGRRARWRAIPARGRAVRVGHRGSWDQHPARRTCRPEVQAAQPAPPTGFVPGIAGGTGLGRGGGPAPRPAPAPPARLENSSCHASMVTPANPSRTGRR
jgi:hypothetical protein